MAEEEIVFQNTNNRTEHIRWYSIEGAPFLNDNSYPFNEQKISPISAKFTFVDGDCIDVMVTGKLVKKDGSVGAKVVQVSSIFMWDQSKWPEWLRDLRTLAYEEFRQFQKAGLAAV